jgi:hypothetical protein
MTLIFVTSVTSDKTCHTMSRGDTSTQKKNGKNAKICQLIIEIDVTHFDTSVTPKVIKFNGPAKDGRGHRRGTYLFLTDCEFEHNLHLNNFY